MSFPPKLKAKFLARFDELIVEGRAILESVVVIPPHSRGNVHVLSTSYSLDYKRFIQWKTSCLSLFEQAVSKGKALAGRVDAFSKVKAEKPGVQFCLGTLEAFKADFEQGFFDSLVTQVEAEIAADYMGQADALLAEGQRGKYDHVPAAVLAGAVLEKALRTLCERQQPQVSTTNSKGEPKTLNPLIDDLKKAGAFAETKAKQLRGWAAVRNHAAHGEFDQFTRSDVEQLLHGVNNFLADHL